MISVPTGNVAAECGNAAKDNVAGIRKRDPVLKKPKKRNEV